ncbi:Inner membrane protein YgaZ [Corynebacterium kalinowskii]|uniref:Inner membrane protein YgaZ n=1 Tax=Corynebacterium kalinowskii TaxID=2675216 RepID=A0A6B8VNR1_9CORY|nr:Inner membrane protein YgaZ [Corynebacterium kalinowskii]
MESQRTKIPGVKEAFAKAGVVWFGLFVLGLGFGVLASNLGFPWWAAFFISATVLAGSMEFILIGLIATNTPLTTIAITTFLVNFRHLFYGLTYPLELFQGKLKKLYVVFCMVDEAFALNANEKDPKTMWWVHIGLHASWALGSLAGALGGAQFLKGAQGLDFVLIALFAVLSLDSWQLTKDKVGALLAAGAAGIGMLAGHQNMMLVAMLLFSGALIVRHRRG